MKNYYAILNVKPTATEEEIKRSYRVLAKRYHPDVNPGNASAAEKFAEVNEANSVLSDPQQRAKYDAELKESARQSQQEDILARQRAQAQAARQAAARQAAARQAAARQAVLRNMSARRPLTAEEARLQAQVAAAQVKAQAQNVQAQINVIKNQAYQSGYDKGYAEGKAAADKDISKLNSEIRSLKFDNKRTNDLLKESEGDRGELEKELFERDRELTREKTRTAELEARIKELDAQIDELKKQEQILKRQAEEAAAATHIKAEFDALRNLLDRAQERIKSMETEKNQTELKHKAQLQLQQDKQKHLREESDTMQRRILELNAELEELRAENNQWQQYAKSEQFLSDAERRLQDWDNKQKADKKMAKPTLYGTLGVLIWATATEIDAAYAKLVKRYDGKPDKDYTAKLEKIKSAYMTLSDPDKRKEYNASIGITEERIEEERQAIVENNKIEEEYRNQLENKEFWARFDELMFSAQTGDAESQNSIGEMYYYGDEIEQDLDQAVYWFKEAAKQKHAEAMYNLGICFVNGEGVEKNKTTGLGFIRQAAKLGSKAAVQYTEKK